MFTPDEVINLLTHLIAMNSHPAVTEIRDKSNAEAIPESNPDSPAPMESSEPTSESQMYTSSIPDYTDTDSTSSNDTVHNKPNFHS